jgi:hypothetical protein
MKSYKELLEEKTRIRLTDPGKHIALNMILDGASKLAKKTNVEVAKTHILDAARGEIAATEKAIELIKSKGGDLTKYVADLKNYNDFLGPQYSEAKIRGDLDTLLNALPPEERVKKNMKRILVSAMMTWDTIGEGDMVDPKVVNRVLASMLA